VAFIVPVIYAVHVSAFYGRYLDRHFVFVPNKVRFAPEDILGFGFWIPWIIMSVLFALAFAVSLRIRGPRACLPLASVAFLAVSAVDFALYGILAGQVLGL